MFVLKLFKCLSGGPEAHSFELGYFIIIISDNILSQPRTALFQQRVPILSDTFQNRMETNKECDTIRSPWKEEAVLLLSTAE